MAAEFEGWAIVEVMGHRRLAGSVREVTIAGAPMLRIDIPRDPPATQYYGSAALFSVTPTTEEDAKRVAAATWPAPVSRYELPSGRSDDDSDDDEPGGNTTGDDDIEF